MTIKVKNSLQLVSKKKNNPRLQVSSVEEYVSIMENLSLDRPKMMDVAIPANIKGITTE